MEQENHINSSNGKARPFRVPNNYFTSFPHRLVDRLLAEEAVASWDEYYKTMVEEARL
ncbi:hypothetical protein [Prevotella vespertina]|uniref:hypothetical protein n=1 Tax=Prevotella vespertina TaxID=2608404 RepID=UPI0018FE7B10|nr:hypothetical protein [Prevotella vespertina]